MPTEIEHSRDAPDGARLRGAERLIWRSPAVDHLDLRDARLRSVTVDGIRGPLTLRLPPTVEHLSLTGQLESTRLDVSPDAALLVQLWGDVGEGMPAGLTPATSLEISDSSRVDLSPLRTMSALRELTVRNVPGPVTGCAAIAAASALERIAFMRCYDIDAAAFPPYTALPRLTWISFDDVSSADAKLLRLRIDGFWNGHVRHPRSPRWLRANDDNPFRTWEDDDPALGHAATALWRRARARLRHPAATADDELVVRQLADALDRLSEERPFDTLRREQASGAVQDLARESLGPDDPLMRWETA
ncbi:MAG: hypothetical protein QM626_07115 [Microbacterium sp.]|uniref:hypothetical protein n=1 Tax=Microbacterium sp. TaxID=51671 RepID=UPI0039E297AE